MKCSAAYIEEKIKNTPNGGVCRLPRGEYYIERRLDIPNRKNLVIDGNGSVIISHYNNGDSNIPTCDGFHICGCENIRLCNFTLETDTPVNITGTVESIHPDEGAYVLSVLPEFRVTGKETFMMQNSCDSDGSFDYRLAYGHRETDETKAPRLAGEILLSSAYTGCNYDYLGGGRFKVFLPPHLLGGLYIGQKICVRHSAYGPISILIKNSNDTYLENINITSAPGMGIVVLPRCRNLYLNNFNIALPRGSERLMSGNCDGIHITGLSGILKIIDSTFCSLGDDALNIHSTAATATAIDEENSVIKCSYRKKDRNDPLSAEWCAAGDIINVLDGKTCKKIGEFKVKCFNNDEICFEKPNGSIMAGGILQNTCFSAAVEMKNCRIRNTRARGCLLQTENIEISDCEFYGISLPAILAAPDIRRWYEVGPIKNMRINNNRFEKCGFINDGFHVISVQDNHDSREAGARGVHENIEVTNNVFERKSGKCIFMTSVNGVKIKGNRFIDCNFNGEFIECPMCENTDIDN